LLRGRIQAEPTRRALRHGGGRQSSGKEQRGAFITKTKAKGARGGRGIAGVGAWQFHNPNATRASPTERPSSKGESPPEGQNPCLKGFKKTFLQRENCGDRKVTTREVRKSRGKKSPLRLL